MYWMATFVNASTGLITRRCFGNWGPLDGETNQRRRGVIDGKEELFPTEAPRRGDITLTFQRRSPWNGRNAL